MKKLLALGSVLVLLGCDEVPQRADYKALPIYCEVLRNFVQNAETVAARRLQAYQIAELNGCFEWRVLLKPFDGHN